MASWSPECSHRGFQLGGWALRRRGAQPGPYLGTVTGHGSRGVKLEQLAPQTHTPATGFVEPRGFLHAPHWSPWVRYGSVLGRRGAVMLPSCQVVCRPLSLSYRQSYRILRGTCHKRVETHEGYHTLSGQSKDPDDSDISLLSTSSPLVLTTPIGSKKHSNIIKNSWTVGPGVRRLGPESGAVLRVRRR